MAARPDAMKSTTLYGCSEEHARQTSEPSKSRRTGELLSTWVSSHVGDHSSATLGFPLCPLISPTITFRSHLIILHSYTCTGHAKCRSCRASQHGLASAARPCTHSLHQERTLLLCLHLSRCTVCIAGSQHRGSFYGVQMLPSCHEITQSFMKMPQR